MHKSSAYSGEELGVGMSAMCQWGDQQAGDQPLHLLCTWRPTNHQIPSVSGGDPGLVTGHGEALPACPTEVTPKNEVLIQPHAALK